MARPITSDPTNRRATRRAVRLEQRRAEYARATLLETMATPGGRATLYAILEETGVYRSAFRASGSETAFLLGEQNIGLKVRARLVAADFDLYLLMETEARSRAAREAREVEAWHLAGAQLDEPDEDDAGNEADTS